MGMLDDLAHTTPQAVQQPKPTKGRFIKEGYFDWDNPAHATPDVNNKSVKEAVGVILPPYASYLSERVAAAKAGLPFNTPFWLSIGNHAMGGRKDMDKVFYHCRRDLIRSNKVLTTYPMLAAEVSSQPDTCPICDTCWDIVWPKVKEFENNKNSNEYKSYKEGHKQLCPQQKYVFNFLPAGSDKPVLLEAAKTLGDHLINLHYDAKQPDLLWPYAVGNFACCWVQLRRADSEQKTDYSAFPVYHNTPHVRNAAGAFDETLYLSILAKAKDLREVSKTYLPAPEDLNKALAKRDKILTFSGLAIARDVNTQVHQATAGVVGSFAQPAPTMPMPPMLTPAPVLVPTSTLSPQPMVSPAGPPMIQSASAPPISAPVATMPPMPASMPAAVQPPAPVSAEANNAFDVLQNLLGKG